MDFARIKNNIKRIIKCFQNIKYAYNENAPTLTVEQYTALNVGAITSEQNGIIAIALRQNLIKKT